MSQFSITTKAHRASVVRKMSNLSRNEFALKYSIPKNTLKIWETPPKNRKGITKKGALRLTNALLHEGIDCSVDWILTGQGEFPCLIASSNACEPKTTWDENESILCEQGIFKSKNPGAHIEILRHNQLEPIYYAGDFLGAIMHKATDLKNSNGKICIIKNKEGKYLIKKITANNLPALRKKATLIGEVIWMRRKSSALATSTS